MWSLQIRKLRTRITLSFALVLIAGQGIGYLLVDAANGRTARAQLDQELVAGERVFERLLTHNRNQMAQAASVLAADYGFREAIATRDADTLNSVLDNHGQRIDAAAMQLFGLDGALIAQSGFQPSRAPYDGSENNGRANFKLTGLLDQAGHRGFASAIVDGSAVPMQIVVVPVRAPLLIAWIAVGFVIDDRFAADLRRLTDLEVSFVRRADARWSVFASTLADDRRRSLDSGFEEVSPLPGGRLIELAGSKFGSRIVKLDRDGGPTGDAGAGSASADGVLAVLQRSLDDKLAGWMLERSIRQCGQWSRQGLELQVSVNVSTRDLLDESLPAMVGRILASHGVAASRICLEITESSFMEDPERAMRTLRELDSLGVELSIDDFGTGFSSLAYLKKLPVDELKIDRDFIKQMVEDAGDFTIVRSTIDLAHNLGLRVVAEGVENAAVFDALAGIGCDVAQGYFLSKPVPADSLVDWIARSRWSTDAGQSLPVSSDNAVSCSQTSAIDS